MKTSFVEDKEINLASIAHLVKIPNMVDYLINPKNVQPKLAGSVVKWIAADIARGRR